MRKMLVLLCLRYNGSFIFKFVPRMNNYMGVVSHFGVWKILRVVIKSSHGTPAEELLACASKWMTDFQVRVRIPNGKSTVSDRGQWVTQFEKGSGPFFFFAFFLVTCFWKQDTSVWSWFNLDHWKITILVGELFPTFGRGKKRGGDSLAITLQ